jgi:hypothetical protein
MATVPAAAAPSDLTGTSVVLVGSFTPAIVQPAHLIGAGLLTEADLAQLRYEILAPEVSVMQVPWMSLVLEPGKLTAQSTLQSPVGEPVRDFVFGFCATLPVKQFTSAGINHDTHFAVSSPEIWHSVGHTLAPKETVWAKVLKEPGMLSLAIQGKRDDDLLGHINVKVEPSIRITPGIYLNVNDHFQAGEEEFKRDPAYLLGTIADNWSASKRRSDSILAVVKALCDGRT